MRREGDDVVAMFHYPPFNADLCPTPLTGLISQAGITKAVYGHLHGKYARVRHVTEIDGARYYLTSCDLVNNKLVRIW